MDQISFRSTVALIESGKPVLLDFTADWCQPCDRLIPVLKSTAAQNSIRPEVIAVDIDQEPSLAAFYNVKTVPTLILFNKGEAKWRQQGILSPNDMEELMKHFQDK
jgi:thioredoxin 1